MRRILIALAACCLASSAWATDPASRGSYPTQQRGTDANSVVMFGLDASNPPIAYPCGSSQVVFGCTSGSGGGGGGGGGGSSNTVTPTPAGTSATTANPIQGVIGGVPVPVTGSFTTTPSGTQTVSGSVAVSALPALPPGSAAIGTVGVTALPSLPAGSATIGAVTLATTQLPTAVVRTSSLSTVTTSGSTPAGATSVSIANTGSTAATVAGSSFAAGLSVTFAARYPDTLAAISYNATGTSLLITVIQ